MQPKADDPDAAEFLRRATRPSMSDEDREQRLLDFMQFMRLSVEHNRHTMAKRKARWLRNRPDEWMHWIHRSLSDALAWDALMLLMDDLLDAPGEFICSPLALWACEVALGRHKRPLTKGRDPYKNLMRDIAAVVTIEQIADLGIRTATTSKKNGKSACHLVGKRLHLDYESVKTIRRTDRRRRERVLSG